MSTRWARQQRDAVVVAGEGAATYLHSQVAQEVRDVDVGASRWTLVLEPNGHVTVLARLWRRAGDEFVLDTEAGFGEALHARLAKFMIRVKATIETAELESVIALGNGAGGAGDLPAPVDGLDGDVVGWWGLGEVSLDAGAAGRALTGGAVEVGVDEMQAARIAAGWPAMGSEIVPGERLPAELGIAGVAVSFTKGCYPGQELVERMDSRGAQAPRRLVRLTVAEGSAVGDPILDGEGKDVGALTSVAGTAALGFVKRAADVGVPVAAPA